MATTDNPRATPGNNSGETDFAKQESERLQIDYAEYGRSALDLIAEAEKITELNDPETKGKVVSLIKRIRDAAKRGDGFRELEKMPHFRRGQGVDQFFFGWIDRLSKRDRKNRDGEADRLQALLNDYDNRVLAAEQERRRQEAAEAQRKAEKLAAEQREKDRIAEEARLAAERARAPAQIEKKEEAAAAAETAASETRVEAVIQSEKAEDAYVATLAKPADIMRTRGNDGTLSTMAREGYAEVEDASKLDPAILWPYISLDAKEKALRQWAKSQGYRTPMQGAAIGFRNKSVVR